MASRRAPITVEKSAYHQQSHPEIGSDNPCSQHLSGNTHFSTNALIRNLSGIIKITIY